MEKLPISAVVVTFNEGTRLRDCLTSLGFCREIIVCDLGSTDNSVTIADELATKVLHAQRVPIVELIIPSLVREASHDWIFKLDPDEIVDPSLVPLIDNAISHAPPDVAIYNLPWEFYFGKRKLKGTHWGGRRYRVTLLNRASVDFVTQIHSGGAVPHEGMRVETIHGTETSFIHHHWAQNYRQLIDKHRRYIQSEGEARYSRGQRFGVAMFMFGILRLAYHNLRPSVWLRDGFWGIALTGLFMWYEISSMLSLRAHQAKIAAQTHRPG